MEDLIELYLFKNKKCPLPTVGLLQVMDTNATASFAEGKIEAPVPTIKLLDSTQPADDFIEFIAREKNTSIENAAALLQQYCDKLENMHSFNETKLPHAGKFYVNEDGGIVFKTKEIPSVFSAAVTAHRVIHPDASHSMVVGDKQTTTTQMAAYYSETEAALKDKWWIWAIVLSVLTAAILFFYFNGQGKAGQFGNTQQIEIPKPAPTYQVAE